MWQLRAISSSKASKKVFRVFSSGITVKKHTPIEVESMLTRLLQKHGGYLSLARLKDRYHEEYKVSLDIPNKIPLSKWLRGFDSINLVHRGTSSFASAKLASPQLASPKQDSDIPSEVIRLLEKHGELPLARLRDEYHKEYNNKLEAPNKIPLSKWLGGSDAIKLEHREGKGKKNGLFLCSINNSEALFHIHTGKSTPSLAPVNQVMTSSLEDYVHELRQGEKDMMGIIQFPLDDGKVLAECLRTNQTLWAWTDGSVKEGYGAHSWTVRAAETLDREPVNVEGVAITVADKKQNAIFPLRAEHSGALAVLYFVKALCSFHRIEHSTGNLFIPIDNMEVVKRLNSKMDPIDIQDTRTSKPDFDVWEESQKVIELIPCKTAAVHVKSHKDDDTEQQDLPRESYWNVRMDRNAKGHRERNESNICFSVGKESLSDTLKVLSNGFKPIKVHHDVEKLSHMLPGRWIESLERIGFDQISDISIDLGRRPYCWRLQDRHFLIDDLSETVSINDLQAIVKQLGIIGSDNRSILDNQLHRISCIRSRSKEISGITIRVGRYIEGNADIILDLLLHSSKSILILGGVSMIIFSSPFRQILCSNLYN